MAYGRVNVGGSNIKIEEIELTGATENEFILCDINEPWKEILLYPSEYTFKNYIYWSDVNITGVGESAAVESVLMLKDSFDQVIWDYGNVVNMAINLIFLKITKTTRGAQIRCMLTPYMIGDTRYQKNQLIIRDTYYSNNMKLSIKYRNDTNKEKYYSTKAIGKMKRIIIK